MINAVQGILAVVAAATMSLPAATAPAPHPGRSRVIGVERQAGEPLAASATANTVRRPMVTRTEEPPRIPTTADFVATDVEFYLGDDGIAYIRPGLQIKVNSIDIPTDRKPLVDVTITDDFGNPLDRSGKITPGVISISWVLSQWDPAAREYIPITKRNVTSPATSPTPGVTAMQATADSGGKWTDLEAGHATYKFGTALPENYSRTATYTLGAYATRNLTDIIGKNYYANPIKDFRPDGAAVTETWAKINQPTSCMNCHAELALHGGSRREVRLCVLCHAEGVSDPDTSNSVDMEVLIHKIHRGPNLANGFKIIGFGGSVHDYSGTTYPQDIRNCQNCHEGTVPAQKPAQSHNYYTEPTRDACGACHDTINWTTGVGHAAGPQANDAACSTCHQPDGPEFGPSIKGAHTIPEKSSQLKGLNAKIVSVSNTKPGDKPTVVFKLTNNDGSAVDGTKLTTFSPILAGPTTSYRNYWREDARSSATFDAASGNTTYTFKAAIPADATGSYAFSADVYRNSTLTRADGEPNITVREAAFNPIQYAAVTGTAATPRRTAVDLAKCNKCHDRLALHGGQRLNTQECVICHNPTNTDVSRRPATAGAPESISFQYMIHRIHTGEELQNDFTIYGFGSNPVHFNEVLFPGNRANCDTCHVNNTEQLPPPITADAVLLPRGFFSPVGPGTAACLGCHDSRDAAAHAFLMTANFPGSDQPAEACATCHGPGADWAVDRVHAE